MPPGTQVLLTHTPPAGHLDVAWRAGSVGCGELAACIARVRPRLCVFGHIHEGHGLEEQQWTRPPDPGQLGAAEATLFVNAASVDISCRAEHTPIVVDLDRAEPDTAPNRAPAPPADVNLVAAEVVGVQ